MTPTVGMFVVCRGLPENVAWPKSNKLPPRVAKVVSVDPLKVVLHVGGMGRLRWHTKPRLVDAAHVDREATMREVAIGMVL